MFQKLPCVHVIHLFSGKQARNPTGTAGSTQASFLTYQESKDQLMFFRLFCSPSHRLLPQQFSLKATLKWLWTVISYLSYLVVYLSQFRDCFVLSWNHIADCIAGCLGFTWSTPGTQVHISTVYLGNLLLYMNEPLCSLWTGCCVVVSCVRVHCIFFQARS